MDFENSQREEIQDVFLGSNYALEQSNLFKLSEIFNLNCKKFHDYDEIVNLLIKKNIIGFFNGRSEFGPRSLGNRSIIADPRNSDAQKKLILK